MLSRVKDVCHSVALGGLNICIMYGRIGGGGGFGCGCVGCAWLWCLVSPAVPKQSVVLLQSKHKWRPRGGSWVRVYALFNMLLCA